ncbi:MAG: ferritin-like domain-containing protein [Chitinophagaceae bacterium]|nr:ferritin-like domain-containing protein [Chitinophagaceae bacterium]
MNFLLWQQYFLGNRDHFDHLEWKDSQTLTALEKQNISQSIRQFQRGEHSEGKHFLQFALRMQDAGYMNTVKLFIKEEQDHAAILGKFMETEGIPKLGRDWLDTIFRRLRKLTGLEGSVTVLLTAEIIAMVYYKALFNATRSAILKQICLQVLKDEEMHLRFQSYTLECLYKHKREFASIFSRTVHHVLMAGTIFMVWIWHYRVLRQGGYSFLQYAKEVWKEFTGCQHMITGKADNQPASSIKKKLIRESNWRA